MKKLRFILTTVCCWMMVMVYAVCTPIQATYLSSGLGDCSRDNTTVWTWDNSYNHAKATAYNKGLSPSEVHLFTPALDMSDSKTVTLSFSHAHKFAGTPSNELTLWVTADYKGSFAASSWQQLTISPYTDNSSWTFVDVTVNVPVEYVGSNTVFAFKYKWTSANSGTWEVKNLKIVTECAGGEIASPVPLPELGDGRLRVFAQNLRNYYWNYNNEQSTRANYDHEAFAKKTRQIVDAMMMTKADIFAFCELEASPQVLVQLADSVNKRVEDAPFVAVVDGIDVPWDSYDNNLKSGFIYRKDKVKPYGSNIAATTANYYKNTQRIQAFEELATKERFTVAMNHFKAKDNSDDQGNATRVMNANNLLNALNKSAVDPDILILGDFNCLKGEEPITILENAGYVEQLLKYEPQAFSHCYNWEGELIDHAFANASMSEYITGAGVFHICTSCGGYSNSAYRYSDHDAYLVAFNLPEKQETECEDLDVTYLTSALNPMVSENGIWYWYNSGSYAKASKSGGYTDYMLTPEMDMTDMSAVSLSFKHAHKFAGTPSEELTLWVTADYQGSYASSSWQQLTISPYTNNTSWTFADVTINVPTSYVGSNTVFAFKYMSTASNYATWEIKNLHITATCNKTGTGMEETRPMQPAQKTIENGQLLITLPDGSVFNGFGIRIR